MITKTKTECETKLCYYDSATRTRFYHGMLLTDEHLRNEQNYHREALKRVNRYLWGSGIACGLTVEKEKSGLCIKVNPGVALDCCGNLIEVCKCITLDLSKECEQHFGSDCFPQNPQVPKDYDITKYLVLRYVEKETDPEPVLTPDTDCKPASEKPNCSASKIREGFCIELWDKCPCPDPCQDAGTNLLATWLQSGEISQLRAAAAPAPQAQQQGAPPYGPNEPIPNCMELSPPCPDCGCRDSAVGLAYLNIHCAENDVEVTCDCRHYVLSPHLLNWILCMRLAKPYTTPTQMALDSLFGRSPTTNLIAAAGEFEHRGDQIKELQKAVERLTKRDKAVEQLTKRINTLEKKPTATPKR